MRSIFRSSLFLCLLSVGSPVHGAEIVKVEETWSLSVGEPNVIANAPQVSMVMSPFSDLEDTFFMFLVNYKTAPGYSAGGAQVQTWDGGDLDEYKNASNDAQLTETSEVVTWTQSMSIQNGTVTFEIKDGTSQTWGGFGGQGILKDSVVTGQSNLNSYHPTISLQQSGIGYAGNRVVSLTLTRITWTMSDGQIYHLNAPIDIDSDLDPWN